MLAGFIGKILTGGLFDTIKELGRAYINKEISEEQYHSQVAIAMKESETTIQAKALEAEAKSFDSFQTTAQTSKVVQYAYVTTIICTLFVQMWFVFIQPFGFAMWEGFPVLKPGDKTLEWNYILLAGMFGLKPLVYGGTADTVKSGMDWIKKRFKD